MILSLFPNSSSFLSFPYPIVNQKVVRYIGPLKNNINSLKCPILTNNIWIYMGKLKLKNINNINFIEKLFNKLFEVKTSSKGRLSLQTIYVYIRIFLYQKNFKEFRIPTKNLYELIGYGKSQGCKHLQTLEEWNLIVRNSDHLSAVIKLINPLGLLHNDMESI